MQTKKQIASRLVFGSMFALAGLWAPGCVWSVEGDEAIMVVDEVVDAGKAIVGGAATTIAQHPWQISLQGFGSHFCGGSIIGDRWVLTAQHCIDGEVAANLTVVAGITRLSAPGQAQQVAVAEILRFPGYVSPEFGKDIALLRLAQPLVFNANVQAIALAVASDNATPVGAAAIVSGWGTVSSGGSSPDQLRSVTVPVVGNGTAQQALGQAISADQLAAGATGRDSCQGDSGGPLTADSGRGRLLVGVVSWGFGCGDPGLPGMYARVSSYASWILENTGAGENPPLEVDVTTLMNQTISGARSSFQHFAITVPAGMTTLDVSLMGNNGDADIYVRRGIRSTANRFDCRPYTDASNESCAFANPASGTWYVSVAGFTAFSAADLVATAR
jgi:secreted trypsin-like serine protease